MKGGWRGYRAVVETHGGSWALGLGSIGVALIGLIAGKLPPGVAPAPDRPVVMAVAVLLATAALAALATRHVLAWRLLAAWWLTAGIVAAIRAAGQTTALPVWVPPLEYLVIGLACGIGGPVGSFGARVMTSAAAVMLALFGAIHVLYHADVGALAPAWIPAREQAPLLSGAIMLGAAAAMLTGQARIAALIVAAMFASWLPLIHAPRLMGGEGLAGEGLFALIALCLVGVMLRVSATTRA